MKRAPREIDIAGILRAPLKIPDKVAIIDEHDLPPAPGLPAVVGSVPGGLPGGDSSITGLIRATTVTAPAPPVVNTPKPTTPQRVQVGGSVIAASLIKRVVPQYPALARQARVQGTVRFTAIISRDGTIQNLQLISGHPLLVPAARDAIAQWVYKPTILNTEPVEVITQIEFTFVLSQ